MNAPKHSPFSDFSIPLPDLEPQPLVSVLIASYNYDAYIEEALSSLKAQTYKHFEAIICDDGSTDTSVDKVQAYCRHDPRFRLYRQPNGGAASALNHAYGKCTGEIVLLLDADDTYSSKKLERIVDYMKKHPACGFLQHNMLIVDNEGTSIRTLGRSGESGWLADILLQRGGRWRNRPASALAFRRNLADLLFPIPAEQFRTAADAFLFTLAPLFTETGYIDKHLAHYRIHGTNITASQRMTLSSIEKRLDALIRISTGVNQKLARIGLDKKMDLSRNVNWQEATLSEALLSGAALKEQLYCFSQLVNAYWKDDLYSFSRKLVGILAYGITMIAPVTYREGVLTTLLGEGGWRRYKGQNSKG